MKATDVETSAVAFTKMWCGLFVGHDPDIPRAMRYFSATASILIPGVPYRLNPESDREEILFSHLEDGRGEVHFWQVLEPQVVLCDNVAIVSYYARYNVGRKGESNIKCAKESLVLLREGDSWTIVHMHNSMAQ